MASIHGVGGRAIRRGTQPGRGGALRWPAGDAFIAANSSNELPHDGRTDNAQSGHQDKGLRQRLPRRTLTSPQFSYYGSVVTPSARSPPVRRNAATLSR